MISVKSQFKPLLTLVTMTIVSMSLTACAPGEEEAVIIDKNAAAAGKTMAKNDKRFDDIRWSFMLVKISRNFKTCI